MSSDSFFRLQELSDKERKEKAKKGRDTSDSDQDRESESSDDRDEEGAAGGAERIAARMAPRWGNKAEFPVAPLRANPDQPAPFLLPDEQKQRQPTRIRRAGPRLNMFKKEDTSEEDQFRLDDLPVEDEVNRRAQVPNFLDKVIRNKPAARQARRPSSSSSSGAGKVTGRLARMQADYKSSEEEEQIVNELLNIKEGHEIAPPASGDRVPANWPPTYPDYLQRKGISESDIMEVLYPPADYKLREDETKTMVKFERILGTNPQAMKNAIAWRRSITDFLYVKTDLLGAGSYGEVYKGTATFPTFEEKKQGESGGCGGSVLVYIARAVVVKVIKRYDRKDMRKYVGNEIEVYNHPLDFLALSALSHGNIVRMYTYTFIEKVGYLAILELLHGGDLAGYNKRWREYTARLHDAFPATCDPNIHYNTDSREYARHGAIPEVAVRSIVLQLLDGLNFCHFHGVAHQDIKPANAMIDKHGTFKLVDFGLAFLYMTKPDAPQKPGAEIGSTGQQMRFAISSCGTAVYMPPEILRVMARVRLPWGASSEFDPSKADIYAVGVMAYVFVVGVIPLIVPFREGGRPDYRDAYDIRNQKDCKEAPWREQIAARQDYNPMSEQMIDYFAKSFEPLWKYRSTVREILTGCEWLQPEVHVDPLWAFIIKSGEIVP